MNRIEEAAKPGDPAEEIATEDMQFMQIVRNPRRIKGIMGALPAQRVEPAHSFPM